MLLIARASVAADSVSLASANWDRELKLSEAPDHNPDPKIVELHLTARIAEVAVDNTHTVRAWTYDGVIPGPLAAKSRFFLLDLEGQTFYVIGSDGGLQERPEITDSLLITPGERVDVIVTPTGSPGGTLTLTADLYNRGYGSVEYRIPEDVLTIAFSDAPTLPKQPMPTPHRDIVAPSLAKKLNDTDCFRRGQAFSPKFTLYTDSESAGHVFESRRRLHNPSKILERSCGR